MAGWLTDQRARAWAVYRDLPAPDRVAHVWRYTDPKLFALPEDALADRERRDLLVADGAAPRGVALADLREAAGRPGTKLADRLGAAVPATAGKLEALNLARWQAGLAVEVASGATVAEPVVLRSRIGADPFQATRLVVDVGADAEVTIVSELEAGAPANGAVQVNAALEVFAGAGSRVRLAVVQDLQGGARLHLAQRTIADRGASVETVVCTLGTAATKADVGAILAGEGADSESWGVVLGGGSQHLDHHTVHEHRAGRTRSNFDYKTVLLDKAHSVYTGLIRIDAHATHCEAYQENRNLMLSETAKADSIPELEILNNEVRCTHGATMGPIEPEYVFYLMSRGLPRADAIRMYVEGFVEPALQRLPGPLADRLRAALDRRLERV